MEHTKKSRGSFSGELGFILAAAGSAVGLGNIWRFPTLAARHGGGVFLLTYIVLVVTFGFTLLTTEITIGRKTGVGPVEAYNKIHPKFGFLGPIATIIPAIILPYYSVIGGWVLKYLIAFLTGHGVDAAADGYFGGFITAQWEPLIMMIIFLGFCAVVAYLGVEKGIEKSSKILMPILFLLVVGIGIFSLTIKITADDGTVRTGLQGLKYYVVPRFNELSFTSYCNTFLDAVGQLFYSVSVAMGIMVAYGSYMPKSSNIPTSISSIEIFDTIVAILAGMMIIPAVYAFSDVSQMNAGPGLVFISLPKIFCQMGAIGHVIGVFFFLLVLFAAVTSCISIMEAIISSISDKKGYSRHKSCTITTIWAFVFAVVVCLGYNIWYFDLKLPNGAVGQILDLFDYVSNSVLMPVLAILECVLIGWVVKPEYIIEELKIGSTKVERQKLYVFMVKFAVPVILLFLLANAFITA